MGGSGMEVKWRWNRSGVKMECGWNRNGMQWVGWFGQAAEEWGMNMGMVEIGLGGAGGVY